MTFAPSKVNRRMFLSTLATAAALPGAAPKGAILELRYYQLRNSADNQFQRLSEFIEKHAMPATKRTGATIAGAFTNLIAPNGPFFLLVNSYPSLAAMEEQQAKLYADPVFAKALGAYYNAPGLNYQRIDVTLLRAFDGMPQVEYPPIEAGKPTRIFELRTYESNNAATLRRKIKMFEDGEIAIFRRLGMRTVFFGSAIAGSRLPHLTYLLGYDDLAHRDSVWKAFAADPEWQKMRVLPGLSDAEVVSNISSILLRPLPYSAIR
jgi:hypothetical protein